MAYQPAYERQVQQHAAVLAGEAPPTLLLVEHPPVITLSKRRNVPEHLLTAPDQLARQGIDLQPTDRGGDITLHAPGQLVAYPIIPLRCLHVGPAGYMRWLEQIILDLLTRWSITAQRIPGQTGIWTTPPDPAEPPAKLCALGVRIRRGITLHGLALNVAPDLTLFHHIIPCGLTNRRVASLNCLLGNHAPTMPAVKAAFIQQFQHAWSAAVGEAS